jgi:hypothetical protein
MKWEYRVEDVADDGVWTNPSGEQKYGPIVDMLNELGDDGWELVQVVPTTDLRAKYLFKRESGPDFVSISTTPHDR